MKTLFIFLALLITVRTFADVPLIRAAGTSPLSYAEFLQSRPQYISYSEFVYRKMQRNETQEQKLFKLGDSLTQNSELALLHLRGIQQESPLTLLSLRYIRDLSERGLQQKTKTADLQTLKHWHCKASILLNEEPVGDSCALQFISFGTLKTRYPQIDKIVIETIQYSLHEDATVPLSKNTAYHWTLMSDSLVPVHFFGTYEQLLLQSFTLVNLVDGQCDGFSTNLEEFSALSPAQIYFSENCQKLSHNMPSPKPWLEDKKPCFMPWGPSL